MKTVGIVIIVASQLLFWSIFWLSGIRLSGAGGGGYDRSFLGVYAAFGPLFNITFLGISFVINENATKNSFLWIWVFILVNSLSLLFFPFVYCNQFTCFDGHFPWEKYKIFAAYIVGTLWISIAFPVSKWRRL